MSDDHLSHQDQPSEPNQQEHSAEIQAALPRPPVPVATYALMVFLVGVYLLEILATDAPGGQMPSWSYVILGGASRHTVWTSHQIWRLFSASFLHAHWGHLALNLAVLCYVGRLIEREAGVAWFLAILLLSNLGAMIASTLSHPLNIFTVGISGGIYGLVAAAAVLGLRRVEDTTARRLLTAAVVLFSIGSISFSAATGALVFGGMIDHAAHSGGLIAGYIAALGLGMNWDKGLERPPERYIAMAIVAVCAVMSLYAVYPIVTSWQSSQKNPSDQFVLGNFRKAAELFEKLPNNPNFENYRSLMVFLSLLKVDPQSAKAMLDSPQTANDATWPKQTFELFRGNATPDMLLALASNPHQTCEANFYIGEYQAFMNRKNEALRYIGVALQTCPRTFFEFQMSLGEIQRLQKN